MVSTIRMKFTVDELSRITNAVIEVNLTYLLNETKQPELVPMPSTDNPSDSSMSEIADIEFDLAYAQNESSSREFAPELNEILGT